MGKITVVTLVSIWTGIAFLPLLIKMNKDKSSEGVPVNLLTLLFTGFTFWVFFSYILKDWFIVVVSAFAWIVDLLTIIFYFKYWPKKMRNDDRQTW